MTTVVLIVLALTALFLVTRKRPGAQARSDTALPNGDGDSRPDGDAPAQEGGGDSGGE